MPRSSATMAAGFGAVTASFRSPCARQRPTSAPSRVDLPRPRGAVSTTLVGPGRSGRPSAPRRTRAWPALSRSRGPWRTGRGMGGVSSTSSQCTRLSPRNRCRRRVNGVDTEGATNSSRTPPPRSSPAAIARASAAGRSGPFRTPGHPVHGPASARPARVGRLRRPAGSGARTRRRRQSNPACGSSRPPGPAPGRNPPPRSDGADRRFA
jgi:hypothetical protein